MSSKKIVDKSMCLCNKGTAPATLSVVSQSIIKTNGMLQATEADKVITPFGVCSITKSACSMALLVWQKTAANSKVNGLAYLTDSSEIMCGIGGKIKFQKTNQDFVKG